MTGDELEFGREAYARRAWMDAHESLSRADQAAPLGAEDLELLATAASMVGLMDDYLALLERAHHVYLDAGEELRAVRCAGWIGMNLAIRGEIGPAGGWFGRAQRLVAGRRDAPRGPRSSRASRRADEFSAVRSSTGQTPSTDGPNQGGRSK